MSAGGLFECFLVAQIAEGNDAQTLDDGNNKPQRQAVVGWKYPQDQNTVEGLHEGIAGLPVFCFPRLSLERRRQYLKPYTYVFALTLQNGEYLYGFCRKFLPPGRFPRRADVEERFPEVLCIVSKRFEVDLFLRVLDCVEARIMLDPAASIGFLDALAKLQPVPTPGSAFRIKSPMCGIVCEYKFSRPRVYEKAHINLVFKHLSPRMIHLLVAFIMNENRIIFVSDSETKISLVIHGLVALIYPFVWQHMFVPLMPEHLFDYLGAPSPYLVGVLTALRPRLKNLPLGNVIIADLDKNQIETNEPLVPFGEINSNDNKFIARSRSEEDLRISSIFAGEINALWSRGSGQFRQVNELSLRTTWVSFNLYVFGWADRYVDAHSGEIQKEAFAASMADPLLQRFCRNFVHTQMFNHFVERLVDHLHRKRHGRQRNSMAQTQTTTGGFRRDGAMLDLQRQEDTLFFEARDQLHGDFTWADVKRAFKSTPVRICHTPSGAVNEALEAIPTSIRTNPKFDPDTDELFQKLARRSYDAMLAVAINKAIWRRVSQTTAKNWRSGYNAMLLLRFMLSAGSEIVLASAFRHIDNVARLLRTGGELNGSRSEESVKQLQRAAATVYHELIDRRTLAWERSHEGGHRLFLASKRKEIDKVTAHLRCRSTPMPRFKDLHESNFDPCVPLKAPLKAHQLEQIPIAPRKTEDLLGLKSYARDTASSRTPPPPPPPPHHSPPVKYQQPFSNTMLQPTIVSAPPPPPPKTTSSTLHLNQTTSAGPPMSAKTFTAPPPPPPPPPSLLRASLPAALPKRPAQSGLSSSSEAASPPPPPPPPKRSSLEASSEQSEKAASMNRPSTAKSGPPPPPPPRAFELESEEGSAQSFNSRSSPPHRAPPHREPSDHSGSSPAPNSPISPDASPPNSASESVNEGWSFDTPSVETHTSSARRGSNKARPPAPQKQNLGKITTNRPPPPTKPATSDQKQPSQQDEKRRPSAPAISTSQKVTAQSYQNVSLGETNSPVSSLLPKESTGAEVEPSKSPSAEASTGAETDSLKSPSVTSPARPPSRPHSSRMDVAASQFDVKAAVEQRESGLKQIQNERNPSHPATPPLPSHRSLSSPSTSLATDGSTDGIDGIKKTSSVGSSGSSRPSSSRIADLASRFDKTLSKSAEDRSNNTKTQDEKKPSIAELRSKFEQGQ